MQRQVGAKSIQAVAIAYVMQKTPYVFPIIGCRKTEQLRANIEALEVRLSEEQIKYLEGVLPFDLGFPNTLVVSAFLALCGDAGMRAHCAGSVGRWLGVRLDDAVGS